MAFDNMQSASSDSSKEERHKCIAIDCQRGLPVRVHMCRYHWALLPYPYRGALVRSYAINLPYENQPSDYKQAVDEAALWMYEHVGDHLGDRGE